MEKKRCFWAGERDYMIKYHDKEWGKPIHNDRMLFEMLILEGAQAGLSWDTILRRRKNYRKAFANFDVKKVAKYTPAKQAALMKDEGIIRNRLKIKSTVMNARAFIAIQKEFGSFDQYLWGFVKNKPIVNRWKQTERLPASTSLSDTISKDLKKRGFKFVGSTIMYAYLQATGLVNDHMVGCFLKKK